MTGRRRLIWAAGITGGLVVLCLLALVGTALWGGRSLVDWLPGDRASSGEVELAHGEMAPGRPWRLTGSTNREQPCVQVYFNDTRASGQCGFRITPSQSGYSPSTTELADGTFLTFGPVPAHSAKVVLRFPDLSQVEVPAQNAPGTPVTFFHVITEHQNYPSATQVRLLDARGNEIPV